jgi:hypothetical protein
VDTVNDNGFLFYHATYTGYQAYRKIISQFDVVETEFEDFFNERLAVSVARSVPPGGQAEDHGFSLKLKSSLKRISGSLFTKCRHNQPIVEADSAARWSGP